MDAFAPAQPAAKSEADDRYQVRSRLEIVATLRAVLSRRALVTVHSGREFIVTAVLAVNPDFEEVIFDYGVDRAMTERLLQASQLEIVTQLDNIRIELAAARAEAVSFEGAPAFRIRLPEVMTRLQRREYYRIRIPLGRPLRCQVAPDPERTEHTVTLRVADLSCGGAALVDVPPSLAPVAGMVYRQCRIALPDLGTVTADLFVVHVHPDTTRAVPTVRFSGQFLGINDATRALIQRYINRIEREKRARQ